MSISCEIYTYHEEPIAGILVSLRCTEHSSYYFEGTTDDAGSIREWFIPGNPSPVRVPWTAGLGDLHWELIFKVASFLGSTAYFSEIRHIIWAPTYQNFNIKVNLDQEMYAVSKDDPTQEYEYLDAIPSMPPGIPPMPPGIPPMPPGIAPDDGNFLQVSPASPCSRIGVGSPLPFNRISGYGEPYSPSQDLGSMGTPHTPEHLNSNEEKKPERCSNNADKLRRSSRLANRHKRQI